MRLRRTQITSGFRLEFQHGHGWVSVAEALKCTAHDARPEAELWSTDMVALLAAPAEVRQSIEAGARNVEPKSAGHADVAIPFMPRSYRDFMLFEAHAIDAARGFVERFMPRAWPIVRGYECLTGRTFPKLRPHSLWYRQPVYYMGNHMSFVADGAEIPIPPYTHALDYELELGFVLAHPLLDADADTAEQAIGGFVVLNDFSARDVQLAEMASGFGPQKAKHFANAISKIVVTADEVLPHWRNFKGHVRLNGMVVSEPETKDARWSLGEVLAHASRAEALYPGEFFGSGTLPGGSGIEAGRLLIAGDEIEIGIEGLGTLTNHIV